MLAWSPSFPSLLNATLFPRPATMREPLPLALAHPASIQVLLPSDPVPRIPHRVLDSLPGGRPPVLELVPAGAEVRFDFVPRPAHVVPPGLVAVAVPRA